eukprot:750416-Hanusia_phi.AAC.2
MTRPGAAGRAALVRYHARYVPYSTVRYYQYGTTVRDGTRTVTHWAGLELGPAAVDTVTRRPARTQGQVIQAFRSLGASEYRISGAGRQDSDTEQLKSG